jgi:hypothetical protein
LPKSSANGVELNSASDPTKFWFFPNRKTALSSVDFIERDLLAIHEELLGKSLHSCVDASATAGEMFFARMNAHFIRRLGFPGRVMATSVGVVGDSGLGSSLGYLMLEGDSWERLIHALTTATLAPCPGR